LGYCLLTEVRKMNNSHPDLSARLRALAAELRSLDLELKSEQAPDSMLLQDFRAAMDDVRLTAWTVSEIMNVRASGRDPEPVLSFLAAERMRRLARMMKDVSVDLDASALTWNSSGVQPLSESVTALQSRLSVLLASHRARIHKVSGDPAR
jgi:hypothetical protein